MKQIRIDLDDATKSLDDVDERIRVARETLISMDNLQLHLIPSPIGCDLKVTSSSSQLGLLLNFDRSWTPNDVKFLLASRCAWR
jgi:hypothetical protein